MNNYATISTNFKGIHKRQIRAISANGGTFKLDKNGTWAIEVVNDGSEYITLKLLHKIDKLGESIKQTWIRTKTKTVIKEKEVDRKIKDNGSDVKGEKKW